MVKVSKEAAEENRRTLAVSADALARRKGLDKVSVAEIAAHAKLTTGAIYTHFGSKNALLAAGIEAGLQRMAEWLSTLANAEEYLQNVRTQGRMQDGSLFCPVMCHIGTIRACSDTEKAAFARGLDQMLSQMALWPDVESKLRAHEVLAQATGYMLFDGLPLEDWTQ